MRRVADEYAAPALAREMQGNTFGPYEIERRLAAGGMAEVFVATRLGPHGFNKRLALKRILPQHAKDPEFLGMFIDEARLAARLEHPGIVTLFDFGEHEGALFMAMELVKGTTVAKLLRSVADEGSLVPIGPALHIALEAAAALAYAHSVCDEDGTPLTIVHRDVSPANLLLTRQGHVKLTDFGIARCRTTVKRTDDGHIRGKLGYMSPEQVVGDPVSAKSDIFTLGILLAEMLLGEPLFGSGADLEILLAIRNLDLRVLREKADLLPAEVFKILDWILRRRPTERPSARQLEDVLREVLVRRGEMGTGPRSLTRLLERLDLVPRTLVDIGEDSVSTAPNVFSASDDGDTTDPEMPAVADGSHRVESSNRYRLKLPDGSIIGPLPFADIVRRLVTTALPAETQISRDAGAYMAPAEISELRRYVLNKSDRWTGPSPDRSEHRGGSLRGGELVAETHRLIDERGTGMVHLTHGSRQKRIYFVDGRPGYVASNSADELFGEFLVRRGTLLRMELEMALAMLAEFDGRLGDAVVGLGILRPMQLFHAVRQQVRERFLEAFRWEDGHWYFVENERTAEETIPLAGSEHELLRDAANEVPHRQLKAALAACIDRPLVTAERFDAVALSYRLPVPWLELMRGLEPPTSLSTLLTRERKFGEEALYRLVFMGLRCGLLKLGDGDATPHSA